MKLLTTTMLRCGLMALALVAGAQSALAASVTQQNLVDLIADSDTIVVGTVTKVTEGFTDNGVPYTEVRLDVSEGIRGANENQFTFRQFGLIAPREIDGRTYLGTTPDGWPNWNERERVMLFLNEPARLTGLQTTVGLNQGKLRWTDGRLANSESNSGLFKGVRINASGLSNEQVAMLESDGEAVDARSFVGLVQRAVNENWIGTGVMRHED